MRALIQRVTTASVSVEGKSVGSVGHGVLVLFCAVSGDTTEQTRKFAAKISKLRIFRDEGGKMNKSLSDIRGSALVVSQFTLAADTSRGNRPGFSQAADPALGKACYKIFVQDLKDLGLDVETGTFGANMQVSLVNDGPVTIWLDDSV